MLVAESSSEWGRSTQELNEVQCREKRILAGNLPRACLEWLKFYFFFNHSQRHVGPKIFVLLNSHSFSNFTMLTFYHFILNLCFLSLLPSYLG